MKKLLSMALAASLCASLAVTGPVMAESTETEAQTEASAANGEHVKNLVVGTTSTLDTKSIPVTVRFLWKVQLQQYCLCELLLPG